MVAFRDEIDIVINEMTNLIKLPCLTVLLFLSFAGTSLRAESENTTLEFKGTPGISFFGICSSVEPYKEKKIEGVSPAEVQMDVHFSKCKIERKAEAGELTVRVFQGRRELLDKRDIPPSSGIELVFSAGRKKIK